MKTHFKKTLAVLLAVLMLASVMVLPTSAAEYRTGKNSVSSSYASGRYYQNFLKVPITGVNRQDLLAIALSQLGYQEGNSDGSFSGTVAGSKNYVEFSYNAGDWGIGYGGTDYPWCASFVSWCLFQSRCTDKGAAKWMGRNYLNSPSGKTMSDYIWKEFSCSQWTRLLNKAGYLKYSRYMGGSYTPKSGDIIYFRNSQGPCHVGIVVYTSGGTVYTVEGNTSSGTGLEANGGGVYFKSYSLTSSYIHSYGVLPYANNALPSIDYSGNNPTTGLYVSNSLKYVYTTETGSTRTTDLPKYRMFEVTEVCSNGRLKINYGGLVGYINNNSDRVIQISTATSGGSTSAPAVSDEVKKALETAINSAKEISYTNYLESTLVSIRSAYDNAVTTLSDTAASEADYTSATETLNTLLKQTATNGGGVRVNGINEKIGTGDCHIFTSAIDKNATGTTWTASVSNANIAYTLNVICAWDSAQQSWVIKSKSVGSGTSTPSLSLSVDEFLIACHTDASVADSVTSYNTLANAKVGDALGFYGITLQGTHLSNSGVSVAAYVRIQEGTDENLVSGKTYDISGDTTVAGEYDANLTDGIATQNINTWNHNWYGFKNSTDNSTNVIDGVGTITFDLSVSHDISKVRLHLANIYSAGVGDPSKITVSVSDDGANFTEYGTAFTTVDCVEGHYNGEITYWATLDNITGLSGKYVRINIAADSPWIFINEVEVYGTSTRGDYNLVSGKDYTISGNGQYYGNDLGTYSADLTDGEITEYYDNLEDWFAFKSHISVGSATNTDAHIGNDGVTEYAMGSITFDLGETYNLTGARVHLGYNIPWGVPNPWGVYLSVSDDGINWTDYADEFPVVEANDGDQYGYWCELSDITNFSGRYVKIMIGVNGTWAFLNEIEIYGSQDPLNVNLVKGDDYTVSGIGTAIAGTVYDADLTDGVASDSWDSDMWNGGVWYAFKNDLKSNGVATNTENGVGKVTFDLGETYDLNRVRVHLGQNNGMGIPQPAYVSLWVSDDGTNFTQYSEAFTVLEAPDDNGYAHWTELTDITGLQGRYVQIQFSVNGTWTFLNEIEVYGTVAQEEVEPDPAPDYGLRGDVNGDGEIKTNDYILLKRALLGSFVLVDKYGEGADYRADINGDGNVKTGDYIMLKRYLLGAYVIEQA